MKLDKIRVKKLFGVFDHEIELLNPDNVTIIHGPNGFGKTILLKMIAAMIDGDSLFFEQIPFQEFEIDFDRGSTRVTLHRDLGQDKMDSKISGKIIHAKAEGDPEEVPFIFPGLDVPKRVLDHVDQAVPTPFRRSGSGWRDQYGRRYSIGQILKRFPETSNFLPSKFKTDVLQEIFKDFEIFFVETRRLDAEHRVIPVPETRVDYYEERALFFPADAARGLQSSELRVTQYSRDIVNRIASLLRTYAKYSQERDRTFPERLVQFVRQNLSPYDSRKILNQMEALEEKRQRFISLGFLDSETVLTDLSEDDVNNTAEALTIYVKDVEEKLSVFDNLALRAGKLIDIVNERFQYKKLSINRDTGFVVENDNGDVVDLEDLSSGEQHELVVLYELLFRTPANGLVLVDEPEISLHVAWQSRFLPDLVDILKMSGSYAIVATHSPVIIGTRWDLTVELAGPRMNARGDEE